MVPQLFLANGNLPPGIHSATFPEIVSRFGNNTHRSGMLLGLSHAMKSLKTAGCTIIYLDGSFITTKEYPGDYDCLWVTKSVDKDLLDPVFLDTSPTGRKRQKMKYRGEFFPANFIEGSTNKLFLDFFQTDRDGESKGIVRIKNW